MTVEIASPEPHARVRRTFTVRGLVDGLSLSTVSESRDGTGHLHAMVDIGCIAPRTKMPRIDGVAFRGAGDGTIEMELEPGPHSTVQIGDGFHSAVDITAHIEVFVVG